MGMIGNSKTGSTILWGSLTKDPVIRHTKNGKTVANFDMRYGYEPKAEGDTGKNKGKYIEVTAWGDIAERYAAYLEKGDTVLVCGNYVKDEFKSKDKPQPIYKIDAEYIMAQPFIDGGAAEETHAPAAKDEPKSTFSEYEGYEDTPFEDASDEDLPF